MTKTEVSLVHVVRHGAVYNPDGVLYARLPGFGLSENGKAMAARVADELADDPVSVLWSSPLQRARETMAPIAAAHPNVDVRVDDRLIEADSRLQGQVFGRHNKALFNPRNWPLFINPLRPSWGEPFTQIAARMLAVIGDAAEQAGPGGHAVLASHQAPIWTARNAAEGRRLADLPNMRRCALASITTFALIQGRIVDVTYREPARDLNREKGNRAFSQGS